MLRTCCFVVFVLGPSSQESILMPHTGKLALEEPRGTCEVATGRWGPIQLESEPLAALAYTGTKISGLLSRF